MGDFYDQAQAIWSTLNSMSEHDPEGYKKFISEQLQQGKSMFGGKECKDLKNGFQKEGKTMSNLEEMFSNLSVGNKGSNCNPKFSESLSDGEVNSTNQKPRMKTTSSSNTPKAKPGLKKYQVHNRQISGAGDATDNLLDNEIGKVSILAQIVNDPKLQSSSNLCSEEEDDPIIKDLVIPTETSLPSFNKSNSNKPLIEEI